MTESTPPRGPNWLPPFLLLLLLASAAAAARTGWSALGEPTADFLVVAAVVAAGMLAWAALDKSLTRRQRLAAFTVLFAVPLVGLMFTDVGPVAAFRDLFRPTPRSAAFEPPPPKEFTYKFPKSEVVPDLFKTGPHDWPGFRGAKRDGRAAAPVKLSSDWKKDPPKLLWQHPVGGGVASPVIVGDFLISHEQRGKYEVVACYELRTGKQCWEHREEQYAHQGYTGPGPQATPTVGGGLVFALGGRGRLLCLDGQTGEKRWHVDLLETHQAGAPGFGITASPLLGFGVVIVGIGGQKGSLVAYTFKDGHFWWSSGSAGASYSSPTLVELAGVGFVVWFRQGGVVACYPKNGSEAWSIPWNEGNGNNVAQPLFFRYAFEFLPDALLISAGDEAGAAAYVIEPTIDGCKPRELWKNKNLRLKFSSAIQVRNMAVGLDEHILAAIDLKTGKRRWKHGNRFGYGQMVASGDQLIVQADDGRVVLGEATDKEFIEHGKFQSVLKQTWNSPALAGDLLVLRNHETLAVYRLPTK